MARPVDVVTMLEHRLPLPIARLGYRVAYRVAQVLWFVLRPDVHGVKGILRDGDRVLLVRHTYGDRRRWDVPGGHAHRGEPPAEAVRREMREELGVDVPWEHLGSLGATTDHKAERVHCFLAERPEGDLVLARAELAEAAWFPLDALPSPLGDVSLRSLRLLPSA